MERVNFFRVPASLSWHEKILSEFELLRKKSSEFELENFKFELFQALVLQQKMESRLSFNVTIRWGPLCIFLQNYYHIGHARVDSFSFLAQNLSGAAGEILW